MHVKDANYHQTPAPFKLTFCNSTALLTRAASTASHLQDPFHSYPPGTSRGRAPNFQQGTIKLQSWQTKVHPARLHKSMLPRCTSFIQRTHTHPALSFSWFTAHTPLSTKHVPVAIPRTIPLRSSPGKRKTHIPHILYVYGTSLASTSITAAAQDAKTLLWLKILTQLLLSRQRYAILKQIFSF